ESTHPAARAVATELATEQWGLFTTNLILAEVHALHLNRLGRRVALRVLQEIDRGATRVVRVSAADEQRARAILSQYDDKDFSLTDATSFTVMERLGIGVVFTFDRNFRHYGFRVFGPAR